MTCFGMYLAILALFHSSLLRYFIFFRFGGGLARVYLSVCACSARTLTSASCTGLPAHYLNREMRRAFSASPTASGRADRTIDP